VAANAIDFAGDSSLEPLQIKSEAIVQLETTQLPDPFASTSTPTLGATRSFADFRDSSISTFELEESEMRRKVETCVPNHDSPEANSGGSIGRTKPLQQRLRFVGYI
jgi:hypothetical protein